MRKIQPFLMSCIFFICAFISFDTINAAEINNSFTSQQISLTGDVTSTFNPAAYTYSATTPKLTAFWDNNNKYHVAYKAIVNYEELDYIIIQRYNDKLSLEKTLKITKDLPLYGNLICDGSYYYVVFGKTDTDSVGTTPVICVSKYDLDGNKVGSCSMTGYDSSPYDDEAYWGTKIPFKAGSCKLAIQGDVLVCNYARQMYSGHQSNYVFYIDKSTMKRNTDIPVAYTSHSFDQAVLPTWDGGYLFANHGDAFERGFDIDYISSKGRRKITSFH